MVAVNISDFTEPEKFKSSVVETIKAWKQSTIRPGFDEVLLPGEIEWRHLVTREQDGIPLNTSLVAELSRIANDLGVAFPSAL
jgi:LDH2 family malate/lactate/ureidoglycolate dehydrogenase